MKKITLVICLLITASLVQAQNFESRSRGTRANPEELVELSRYIYQEIKAKAHVLSYQDSEQVRRLLNRVDQILYKSQPAPYPGPGPQPQPVNPYVPMTCDSNNNVLLDRNFQPIYDFSSLVDCQQAIQNIERNLPFCDYSNNQLHRPGRMIYDFGSKEDCDLGIQQVSRNKPFCDFNDNTLRKPDGSLLYDFSTRQDCTDAMNKY